MHLQQQPSVLTAADGTGYYAQSLKGLQENYANTNKNSTESCQLVNVDSVKTWQRNYENRV